MHNDDTIDLLHHLASVNKDSEAGLRSAAESAENSELESLFLGYAKQHAKFLAELESEIERLGGKACHSGAPAGGLGGAIERGWMDMKSALTGHSAAALLSSCENGELHAEVAYTDAVKANPSGQTHTLVEKHLQQIIGFRKRLARLVGETKDGIDFQKNDVQRNDSKKDRQ